MKISSSIFLTAAFLCFSGSAGEFSPGGVSVDFHKISEARFASAGEKKNNLFTPQWKPGTVFLHSPDPRAQKLRSKALPFIKFSKQELKNSFILKTAKGSEIADVAGKYARSISASWTQSVPLPDTRGGDYRLTFRSKVTPAGKKAAPLSAAVITLKMVKGKKGSAIVKVFHSSATEFVKNEIVFQFPEGTESALFYLRLDGCGTMEIKDPVLEKVQHAFPVEAALYPNGKLDNVFVLSQNDPAVMAFILKRNVPAAALKLKEPVFKVTLPPEIEFVDHAYPLKLISRKGNTLFFDASFWISRLQRFDNYETHMKLPLLVTTKAAVGEYAGTGTFQLTDSGKNLTEEMFFKFRVIPQIKKAAQSNIFLPGYQPMGLYLDFSKKASRKLFADFSGRAGFRWICQSFDPETTAFYRRSGAKLITPELYWLANGYRICPQKPDYAKFKSLGKTSSFDVNQGTCPAAIYNKTPFFHDTFVPYLKKELKGKDGVVANWEPFMFHGQGCFCDTCCKEFADFVKIPHAEMKKMWPKELTITGKYYAQGVRFRSLQHAKMVKTIHEAVNKVTSGKAGFIPEIVWITCADTTARGGSNSEHDPLDYAGDLTYIDPWGPYTGWQSLTPYNYKKGENLETYVAAGRVRSFMKKNLGSKCPRLVALPHGIQGKFWVTTPEAMAMEVTGFFVQRYHAAHLYLFPQGYDNRYWSVMAENNDLIARNEEFVFNGKCITENVAAEPVSPFPSPKKRISPRYLVDPAPESLLQYEAFRKGETILVAAGNFWQKGEVFFKLKVKGLKKNASYAVTEAAFNRSFVSESGRFFTGAELEKGVMLHAGALRWAFFRIEPAGKEVSAYKKITPQQLLSAMKKRLSVIDKAAAEEKKQDDAIEEEFRKAELRTLVNGPLKCMPAPGREGGQVLNFSSGKNSLSFDLQHCAIRNWVIDGTLWSEQMGRPMFWEPSNAADARYRIVRQDVEGSGITVTAERLFNRRNSAALEHLTIRQTMFVSKDLRSLKLTTELIDSHNAETGGGGFTLGFRYHFFPGNMDGRSGEILLSSGGKPYNYQRTMERLIFAKGKSASAAKIGKLFECHNTPLLIDKSDVSLRHKKSGDVLKIKAAPEKLFAGYAVWDTPNLKYPTFEPFFHPVSIENGKSAVFTLEMKAEKAK